MKKSIVLMGFALSAVIFSATSVAESATGGFFDKIEKLDASMNNELTIPIGVYLKYIAKSSGYDLNIGEKCDLLEPIKATNGGLIRDHLLNVQTQMNNKSLSIDHEELTIRLRCPIAPLF